MQKKVQIEIKQTQKVLYFEIQKKFKKILKVKNEKNMYTIIGYFLLF